MKRENANLLIGFLIVVLLLGGWQFIVTVNDLKKEREELKKAKIQMIEERRELQSQIDKITKELEAARFELKKISTLEKENADLIQVKKELEEKVTSLEKEKQDLEAKLHSLPELKKAIRQVKIEKHEQKAKEHLAKKQQQKELDAQGIATGNRGFVIKDSKSTYKPRVIIEVFPGD